MENNVSSHATAGVKFISSSPQTITMNAHAIRESGKLHSAYTACANAIRENYLALWVASGYSVTPRQTSGSARRDAARLDDVGTSENSFRIEVTSSLRRFGELMRVRQVRAGSHSTR